MGTVLLTVILAAAAISAGQPCRLASATVEQAIAAKAAALKGAEYCEYRHYSSLADLDGDGKDDFAVTFNVEGPGNDVHSYLLVYLSSAPAEGAPLEAEAGTRGKYLPSSLHGGADHRLVIETQKWLEKDAMCCPSGKGQVIFTVSGGKLRRAD